MPTAKQIKARKLFAMRAKRGDFKKKIAKKKRIAKSQKSNLPSHDLPSAKARYEQKYKSGEIEEKDYGTPKDPHQIPQEMLDELYQSTVRGMPFFVYTGIKEFLLMGNDSLMLKSIPSNPAHISTIQVNYNRGSDSFYIIFWKGNTPERSGELYVGDLADTIVEKMGIT